MSCKDINTQAELDAALADDSVTCVHVKSERGVWITLRDNRTKRVEAYGSATVRAYGSATVRAYGSATVEASDSATVEAYGSATVEASDSATVEAYGSATVRAYGSAGVHAHRYASVTAGTHVAVHLHEATATVSGGVLIDLTQLNLEDTPTWLDHHGVTVIASRAVLYKALGDDLTAGRGWNYPVTYVIGEDLVCADWRDDHECGGGLHLSPTPAMARHYRSGATRYLRCTVAVEDIRPIVGGTPKAKVRALRVEAEVDLFQRETAAVR